MPQALNLVVDGGVLLNVGVSLGDVGLRLIVVVIRDKLLHSIVRKKLPEFAAQLGGQGFVVSQDQGRAV